MNKTLILVVGILAALWYYNKQKQGESEQGSDEVTTTAPARSAGSVDANPISNPSGTQIGETAPQTIVFNPQIVTQSQSSSVSSPAVSSGTTSNLSTLPTPEANRESTPAEICRNMGGVYVGNCVCQRGSLLTKVC